jgi:hypothetical protein
MDWVFKYSSLRLDFKGLIFVDISQVQILLDYTVVSLGQLTCYMLFEVQLVSTHVFFNY